MATLATYGHLSASGCLYISFCWQGKVNSYTCTLCICAHSTIASLVGCDVLLSSAVLAPLAPLRSQEFRPKSPAGRAHDVPPIGRASQPRAQQGQ